MTPVEIVNRLRPDVLMAQMHEGGYQCALGFIRYEVIRKLDPRQFADLYKENLETKVPFDTLVDRLILNSRKP